ncbi:DoxX family protein [Ferruginibacter lapsinanis]|uniref:DoxX family protein n=1 Tax=Ferruginibacter lapsinanis TaxID=563172 RepID=UPI001E54F9AE|nr:DoxX family protein [Ferruginibacter lapsinanis]UEG48774.1 DoxX family protein [Ferruginibacter lapsinanis]
MNLLQKFEYWGDRHHPKWLDVIRIALGIFLCYKGIDYLRNTSELIGLMTNRSPFGSFLIILLAHYVTFAHILGGFLLIIGFLTRLACLIQIPILLGAIILVNITQDVTRPYSDLFLSIIILLLLIYFLIVGNGPWGIKLPDEKKRQITE